MKNSILYISKLKKNTVQNTVASMSGCKRAFCHRHSCVCIEILEREFVRRPTIHV